MNQTHHTTIEAELRRIANQCDLSGLNTVYFLKSTMISNIATLIQQYESAAFERGVQAANLIR